jgi:hypothetical protein
MKIAMKRLTGFSAFLTFRIVTSPLSCVSHQPDRRRCKGTHLQLLLKTAAAVSGEDGCPAPREVRILKAIKPFKCQVERATI